MQADVDIYWAILLSVKTYFGGMVFREGDTRGYVGGKFTKKEQYSTVGIRLVFILRGIGVPKDLNLYFKNK